MCFWTVQVFIVGPINIFDLAYSSSVARFLESRGNIAQALEVATDPDYRFELAIQLGKLGIAQVIYQFS